MGRPSAKQRKPYNLDAILDVAVRVFLERGYDGSSLDQVALAAGITKASIYYHVRSKEELLARGVGRALDALLPADVAIRDVRRATAAFHPRYAARYREYRYTVWNGPRSPLRERAALGVRVPLDTAAMERAGSAFIGRHDFLRGMVRRIVAILLEVGRGKLNETDVRAALAARRPALDGAAAPAQGLCLRRVVLGRRTGGAYGDD